jgi:hypothetical protein
MYGFAALVGCGAYGLADVGADWAADNCAPAGANGMAVSDPEHPYRALRAWLQLLHYNYSAPFYSILLYVGVA